MSIKVLTLGRHPHYCNLPGWRERRRLGILPHAQVQCDECGSVYEWDDWGWGDVDRYWRRLHRAEGNGNVEPSEPGSAGADREGD